MIKQKPTRGQFEYARLFTNKINTANRGRYDGNRRQRFAGILAEIVFADLMRIERPKIKSENDQGIDFVINYQNIDIKCQLANIARKKGYEVKLHWKSNLLACQRDNPNSLTDIYLFCQCDLYDGSITFIGLKSKADITKDYFVRLGEPIGRDDGTTLKAYADCYMIPNDEIKAIYSPEDIDNAISAMAIPKEHLFDITLDSVFDSMI